MLAASRPIDGFSETGVVVLDGFIPHQAAEVAAIAADSLQGEQEKRRGGVRRALSGCPALQRLAQLPQVRELVDHLGDGRSRPVRSILFDKTPETNWLVPWHQDTTIAVARRVDVLGYGPWSIKDGVPHTQPPARVFDGMFTIRLHLDPCGAGNGPLRVIPDTHRLGILDEQDVARLTAERAYVECATDLGGAVVMHPLALHSSPRAERPGRRRVLHIEYAKSELDGGLSWRDEV